MTDPILLQVDNELADQIVAAWLKQHIIFAELTIERSIHEQDRKDAEKDMKAFSKVLEYMGALND